MSLKVSVIVPIYKVEKYLTRCIESIRSQSYENLEIILVDDGSPDHCDKICDEYAMKDSRIQVIHKKNGGLSDARNAGMKIATGQIISFIDSDDWIEPDMLKDMVGMMNTHDSDIVVCGFYTTDGTVKHNSYITDQVFNYTPTEALEILCESRIIESHAWDKIYRREVLEGIEFPKGKLYEDVFVMHSIFEKAKQITFIDHPYYNYYQRQGSILSERSLQSYLDLKEGMEKRLKDLSSYPDSITEWVRFRLIRGIIDVFRIMAGLKKHDKVIESDCLQTIKKQDSDGHLGKRLDRNMRIEYLILRKVPVFYRPFRRIVTALKENKLRRTLGFIKRSLISIIKSIKTFVFPFSDSRLSDRKSQCKRIILMGGAEYDNLGDHAISFATEQYIKSMDDNFVYCEVTEQELRSKLSKLKKLIHKSDILLLQGGGNLGNIYMDQQKLRASVLTAFPDNKIILMPQTCHFTDDANGRKELKHTQTLFSSHKNLSLFAREKISYENMKMLFPDKPVHLVPDIVLSLERPGKQKRKGAALCIRNDIEGLLELPEKELLVKSCKAVYGSVQEFSTCGNRHYSMRERATILNQFFDMVASYELVITDRLHGVIFSAITGTPCIALSNSNHKIIGICQWLKNVPTIQYCENVYEIEKTVQQLLNTDISFSLDLTNEFASLSDVIRS